MVIKAIHGAGDPLGFRHVDPFCWKEVALTEWRENPSNGIKGENRLS